LNEFLFACLLIFGSSFEQISAREEVIIRKLWQEDPKILTLQKIWLI